jgi:hypothetical protein
MALRYLEKRAGIFGRARLRPSRRWHLARQEARPPRITEVHSAPLTRSHQRSQLRIPISHFFRSVVSVQSVVKNLALPQNLWVSIQRMGSDPIRQEGTSECTLKQRMVNQPDSKFFRRIWLRTNRRRLAFGRKCRILKHTSAKM